jgi:hypothetical protein
MFQSTRSHPIGAGMLAASLTGTALAGLPDYEQFELIARSGFTSAYRLPVSHFFANASPELNDDRLVAFKLDVMGGTGTQGIFVGDVDAGDIRYTSPFDAGVSDPDINNDGMTVFEQSFSSNNGLYFYDHGDGSSGILTTQPIGATVWGSPSINDNGEIGYRVKFGFTGQAFYSFDGVSAAGHVFETGVVPASPYAFLFTPGFNNNRQIAGKVLIGSFSGPQEIRIFNSDETSVFIVEDDGGDPTSPFASFDNTVAVNDLGQVAFIASLVGGVRGVYVANGTDDPIEIATENDPDVSDIEFFHPDINNKGQVTFRAFDGNGLRAVFVGDGTELEKIITEHDLIETDLGTGRIDQNDSSPTFGGSPSINEKGDVAFHCTLTPPDDDQIEWGSGIYVAVASKLGDVDGDGEVGVSDFFALLQNWGACPTPPGDCPWDFAPDGGDGEVGVSDFFALLQNWG